MTELDSLKLLVYLAKTWLIGVDKSKLKELVISLNMLVVRVAKNRLYFILVSFLFLFSF